jgi:hypothetical protein
MYQATMAAISAEQNKDRREQATAWRRARDARGPVRARSASPFALIARGARPMARQKRQGPAEA